VKSNTIFFPSLLFLRRRKKVENKPDQTESYPYFWVNQMTSYLNFESLNY
jgi:hypothetical protein